MEAALLIIDHSKLESILAIILTIPIILILVWSFYYPRDSILLGKRWMYKEEPEISDEAIRFRKIGSFIMLLIIALIVITSIYSLFQ